MKVSTVAGAATPNIEIDSININFSISYRDVTDTANSKSGNYREDANLQFANEAELNRVLTDKAFLLEIVPIIVARLTKGYDPENTNAKKLKADVKGVLAPAEAKQ